MLISMLKCQTSLAEQTPLKLKPVCIDRNEEEKFVVCFEENLMCHNALRKLSAETKFDWQSGTLAALTGVVLGIILSSKIKH
jgi:hypothetical protein